MVFNADSETAAAVAAQQWRFSGETVKVVSSYKYLEVDLLANVRDWSQYINRAIASATVSQKIWNGPVAGTRV